MILSETTAGTNNNRLLAMEEVENGTEKLGKIDDSLASAESSSPPSNRFFVNTSDSCFLCLKITSSLTSGFYSHGTHGSKVNCTSVKFNCGGDVIKRENYDQSSESSCNGNGRHEETSEDFRHWNIFNYLNITPCSIVKSLEKGSPPPQEEETDGQQMVDDEEDDNSDFSVLICEDCAAVAIKMSKLCEELDLIQMRVDKCVESVHEIIAKSDSDPKRVEEFRDKQALAIRDGTEEFVGEDGVSVNDLHRKIVDLLRKETREKCLTRLKNRRIPKSKQAKLRSEYAVVDEKNIKITTNALEEVTASTGAAVEFGQNPIRVDETSGVLVLKQEDSLSPHSSSLVVVQDLQTEWIDGAPEVDQEISMGICDDNERNLTAPTISSTVNDLMLFEQLPSLPSLTVPSSSSVPNIKSEEASVLEEIVDPGASLIHPSVILSNGILPPPPPPVNIPRKPRKTKKKKVKIPPNEPNQIKTFGDVKLPIISGNSVSQCPVDFYFHKKIDNRHHCLFCSDTSPTLTNLRFHVIRAHLEQLFSTSRPKHIPIKDFKGVCELMLSTITKESDTGLKNPSGTKAIVRCKFCRGNCNKIYHDKRAFQCHLILNHYQILTQRLMELQKEKFGINEGSISPGTIPLSSVSPLPLPPVIGDGGSNVVTNGSLLTPENDKNKRKNSCESIDASPPKTQCTDTVNSEGNMINGVVVNGGNSHVNGTVGKSSNGSFICEHCGKMFSSSGSKWRHKQQYCGVLRNRGDLPIQRQGYPSSSSSTPVDNMDSNSSGFLKNLSCVAATTSPNGNQPVTTSSVYLITPHGEILGSSNVIRSNAFITTSAAAATTTTTMSTNSNSNGSNSNDDTATGLELLLQQANDMIMKEDNSCSGAEEVAEEYEQFVSDFQEFYDEDEVNDALLTMMMENVPEEDPLQI